MNLSQIEFWALNVIERANNGRKVEDSRVELKAEWPTDIAKTARQIAGHANSAGGEPILWLIGVDENAGVKGASSTDLASWLQQIESQFDGIAPKFTAINVPTGNQSVVALLFETDRRPFVVKNPVFGKTGGGSVELEVPWRDSTRVRSSKREDLIRLLVPIYSLPSLELVSGELIVRKGVNKNYSDAFIWRLDLQIYIVPKSKDLIVIPYFRCTCAAESDAQENRRVVFEQVEIKPPYRSQIGYTSMTVKATYHEAIIEGPGMAHLIANAEVPVKDMPYPFPQETFEINAQICLAEHPICLPLTVKLKLSAFSPEKGEDQEIRWTLEE